MATQEEMKNEAIRRLQAMQIYKPYINGFKSKAQRVCFYENFGGFWVDQEPEVEQKMKEVEQEYNGVVYAITHEFTNFGECWSFLMVSKYDEEWEYEFEQYGNKFRTFAYVWNVDDDMCSEAGDIAVQSFGGGIRRIG